MRVSLVHVGCLIYPAYLNILQNSTIAIRKRPHYKPTQFFIKILSFAPKQQAGTQACQSTQRSYKNVFKIFNYQ